MKESTVNAFKKIADLTNKKCQECPGGDKFRCCDKIFCEAAQIPRGMIFEKPNVNGIPYMSENGCVLPPHYRPMCAGFICGGHLKDRKLRREYDRIVDKIKKDPEFTKFPDSSHLTEIAGAFDAKWWGHNRKEKTP